MNHSNADTIHFFYFLSLKKHTRRVRETNACLPQLEKKRENLQSGLGCSLARLTSLQTLDPIDTFHVWPGGASSTE